VSYDSAPDTIAHILRVRELLWSVQKRLESRGQHHDASKLQEPEKSAFDRATPRLKTTTYGSPEYKANLADIREAVAHHQAHNSHHPEHYPNGMAGMSLLDLIEMICDWKAAGERHAAGDIRESLRINVERFGIEPQLANVLRATVEELYPVREPA
jgi:hypothetical protein